MLAYRLKDAAVLQGLIDARQTSYARLARHADHADSSYVWRLAHGKASAVTQRTALLIAEALNVPVAMLFEPKIKATGTAKIPA